MEEEGFGKIESSSWASRLSPLAQPFTMKRQDIEPLTLNSSTAPKPRKNFAPSPSNRIDTFDNSLPPNSLNDLINLKDQSDPSLSASAFPFDGTESSFSRNSSSLPYETQLENFLVDYMSFVSSLSAQGSVYQGQGRTKDGKSFVFPSEARASTLKSFVKQDSVLNPLRVSTGPDVSFSTFQNDTRVPVDGSSATSTTFPPSTRAPSSAVGSTGNSFANNNHGSCDGNISGKKKLHEVPNSNAHVAFRDKILLHNEKEKNDVKSVTRKELDPLLIPKSEFKVFSEDPSDGLILGRSGTITGLSFESSSKRLDENDEDLDSPCWKGIQNSGKSPVAVSECLSSISLQNDSEASPSLNPQAPQFFPSNGKGIIDYSKNNSVGNGFQSSSGVSNKDKKHVEPLKAGPNPPGFSNASKYQHSNRKHVKLLKAGPIPPGFSNASKHQYSNRTRETGKEPILLKSSKAATATNLPQTAKPSLVDGEIPTMNFATDQIQNFPSSGLDPHHDFSQVLQSLSMSSSRCPNVDVNMVVKAIRYLSELLVESCTNDYDSLNANEHEMIQCVIENLCVLIKPSLCPEGLDFHDKVRKALVVQPELHGWRVDNWVDSYSQATALETDNLGSSSSYAERGNDVNQYDVRAFRTVLKENGQINGNLDSDALLNLWIEGQAALCSVKYENKILRKHLQLHTNGL